MSKLFKGIVAGILAVVVCALGTPVTADIDETTGAISISTTIAGTTDLSFGYIVTATGADGTGSLSFDLSGLDLNDGTTLWAVADEGIVVNYASNYSWGVRIITDNQDVVDTLLASAGETAYDNNGDGDIDISDYVPGNDIGSGSMAYSGLLSVGDIQDVVDTNDGSVNPSTDQDPSNRATLAWQGYDAYTDPSAYAPESSFTGSGAGSFIEDDNVGDVWDSEGIGVLGYDDWNYIGDKGDDGFEDEIFTDSSADLTYPMVAIGAAGANGDLIPATGGNIDGSMPSLSDDYTIVSTTNVDASADGNGDLVLFLAARFASTNWGETDPFPYVLEPDTYTTSLYVELIHE